MILLLLFVFYSFHLCAIIREGVSFDSHPVKMLGDRHPAPGHRPDQEKVKNQLAIIEAFLQCQSQQNTVVLAEEISPSIARCIPQACILKDIRALAECYGLHYENIDLRGATLAAGHVIQRCLGGKSINRRLSFGLTQESMATPSLVTLYDLYEEKERYVDCIKKRFSWSDVEQKRVDELQVALFNTLKGWNLNTTVDAFCRNSASCLQRKLYGQIDDIRFLLFDNYAKKIVMEYYKQHYTILIVGGYRHIQRIRNQLVTDHGWSDDRFHYNGGVLTNYSLKSTLGITTWWDRTKNCFGYVD